MNDRINALVRNGKSVTFCPIDPLNPQIGMTCLIEGSFGRVSGDSDSGDQYEAFDKAMLQLSYVGNGLPSNVRPILSLADMVRGLTPSGQAQILEVIQKSR